MDAAGNIFGVSGVTNENGGTVFELSPNGNGGWNPTVIHTFTGAPEDGWDPEGAPALDKAGNVYGTTWSGGAKNYGTVYKLSPGRRGKWTAQILYSFKGVQNIAVVPIVDGGWPAAGIVFDSSGNMYGTTFGGGKYGYGTVFELVAVGAAGSYKEKILWSFKLADGRYPQDSMILDSAGKLYGTTSWGGSNDYGVVFEVAP